MMNDNIKVDNKNRYVCTIFFHHSMLLPSVSALEDFLLLKSWREFIECHIWYDYENDCFTIKIIGESLTNVLRTRFEIINYFLVPL